MMTPQIHIPATDASSAYTLARPGAAAPAQGLLVDRLVAVSALQRPLSIPGIAAAPTSSLDAELENTDGYLTRLWGPHPPVRRRASVADAATGAPLFDGIVTACAEGFHGIRDVILPTQIR